MEAKIGVLAEDPWIHQRRVRVKAAGRLSLLPPSTVAVIRRAEEATADYDAMTLTIAVAYGEREEIADAVRDLIRAKCGTGSALMNSPNTSPPLLSTNISARSGFRIPISSSAPAAGRGYRAFCYGKAFTANYFGPEFCKVDFLHAIRSFQQRTRRFGQ